MENSEEILHSLEEFSKTKPKDIPRELEEYLCFVAKTGDPIYQWSAVKSLFREKLINVITEFYETCPSVEIPPCPNVDIFNYDVMKNFILEKLDTFAAAPFTLQRICELLTTPRKEYNRIDKYMRALEKNVLVVSTTEPGGRRSTENGEGIMNGLESEHLPETSNSSNDINVEEMDEAPSWPRMLQNEAVSFQTNSDNADNTEQTVQEASVSPSKLTEAMCSSTQDTVITCRSADEPYVSIEPVPSNTCVRENVEDSDVSVTITAIPAGVQKRRNSVEPVVSSEATEEVSESSVSSDNTEKPEVEDESKVEETSTSDEIKDADSSSSAQESPDDKAPDTSDTVTESNLVLEQEIEKNEVDTSGDQGDDEEHPKTPEITEEVDKNEPESNECNSSDTTKCSQEESLEKEVVEEISTSSSTADNEVESSDSSIPPAAESKLEEDTVNEALSVADKEETAMEVDEEVSEKVEEVVKAEATSDSPL